MSAYLSLKYSEENRAFVFNNKEHEEQLHQVVGEHGHSEHFYTVNLRDEQGVPFTLVALAEQLADYRDDHPACLGAIQKFLGEIPILEGFVVVR